MVENKFYIGECHSGYTLEFNLKTARQMLDFKKAVHTHSEYNTDFGDLFGGFSFECKYQLIHPKYESLPDDTVKATLVVFFQNEGVFEDDTMFGFKEMVVNFINSKVKL